MTRADDRLSPDGPTRWPAVARTRTRCQHCCADIVQPQPGGWWVGAAEGGEAPTCARGIRHAPMPHVAAEETP
jgi:hypothetical protein